MTGSDRDAAPLLESRNDRAYASLLAVSALGLTLAIWKDSGALLVFGWLGAVLVWCIFSCWRAGAPQARQSLNSISVIVMEVVLASLWCVPVLLWFGGAEISTQLVVIVFYFVAALAGTIVHQSHPIASVTSAGLALPLCAYLLWRNSGTEALFSTIAIVGAWLCILALGWTLRLAHLGRERLRADRARLIETLAQTLQDLETARQSEAVAREAADLANQDKSRFLAHVSHDLRQPVHAAHLLMESVPEEVYQKAGADGVFGQVRRSVSNLAQMFDALLDTAMLESGQNRVVRRNIALSQMFALLAEECSELAEREGIELRFQASGYQVNTDPVLLSRMIRNLVVNAIQHSAGSAILVGARWNGNGVSIEVRDNGRGIEASERNKIFEEFQRSGGKDTRSAGKNLGLGLSIVQRLCRVLDLDVTLKSEVGQGSRFTIGPLPLSDGGGVDVANEPASDSIQTGLNILVVEDDPDTLQGLKALLQKWGHQVEASLDGDLSDLSGPDLLIADYHLGMGLTGLWVIETARQKWGYGLPALVITGETAPEILDSISSAGLRHLPKPAKPVALKSAILASQGQLNKASET